MPSTFSLNNDFSSIEGDRFTLSQENGPSSNAANSRRNKIENLFGIDLSSRLANHILKPTQKESSLSLGSKIITTSEEKDFLPINNSSLQPADDQKLSSLMRTDILKDQLEKMNDQTIRLREQTEQFFDEVQHLEHKIQRLEDRHRSKSDQFDEFARFQGNILAALEYYDVNYENFLQILSSHLSPEQFKAIEEQFKNFDSAFKWTNCIAPLVFNVAKYCINKQIQQELEELQKRFQELKSQTKTIKFQISSSLVTDNIEKIQHCIDHLKNQIARNQEEANVKGWSRLSKLASKVSPVPLEKLSGIAHKKATKICRHAFGIYTQYKGICALRKIRPIPKKWHFHLQSRIAVLIDNPDPSNFQNKLYHEVKNFLTSLETCSTIQEVKKKLKEAKIELDVPSNLGDWQKQFHSTRFQRHLIQSYYYSVGKRPFMNESHIESILKKRMKDREIKIENASGFIQKHIAACHEMEFDQIVKYFKDLHVDFEQINFQKIFLKLYETSNPITKEEWNKLIEGFIKEKCDKQIEDFINHIAVYHEKEFDQIFKYFKDLNVDEQINFQENFLKLSNPITKEFDQIFKYFKDLHVDEQINFQENFLKLNKTSNPITKEFDQIFKYFKDLHVDEQINFQENFLKLYKTSNPITKEEWNKLIEGFIKEKWDKLIKDSEFCKSLMAWNKLSTKEKWDKLIEDSEFCNSLTASNKLRKKIWDNLFEKKEDNLFEKKEFCESLTAQWVDYQETTGQLLMQSLRQALLSKNRIESKFLSFRDFEYKISIVSSFLQLALFAPKVQDLLKPATLFFKLLFTDLTKIGIPGAGLINIFYPLYPEMRFKLDSILMMLIEHVFGSRYKPNEYSLEGYKLSLQIRWFSLVMIAHYLLLLFEQTLVWLNVRLIKNCIMRIEKQPIEKDSRFIQLNTSYEQCRLSCKSHIKELEECLNQLALKDSKLIIHPNMRKAGKDGKEFDPIQNLVEGLKDANFDYFSPEVHEFIEENLGIKLTEANKARLKETLEEFFSASEDEFINNYQANQLAYLKA